jgi:hypothetical protein
MRQNSGVRATTAEHPATPGVAPRFTRAAEAEGSRLEASASSWCASARRRRPRSGASTTPSGAVDELLELLAPLLYRNGSEPEAASQRDPGDEPERPKE